MKGWEVGERGTGAISKGAKLKRNIAEKVSVPLRCQTDVKSDHTLRKKRIKCMD